MILNVSGRTDVVAFYTPWFLNRLKEGFIDVRNPFVKTQVSRIYFKDVDLILFCTKNPIPIEKHLKDINKPIIFHVTITPYNKDLEINVASKTEIINSVKRISKIVGIDNLYIRYDPILKNKKYNIEYHKKAFNKLCNLLNGYVKNIIVSFIDDYKNVSKNKDVLNLEELTEDDYKEIDTYFSKVAKQNNMTVQTCSEEKNLCEYGFIKRDCISRNLAFKMTGKTNFKLWKARKNNACKCVEMTDIGVYNTCNHFCKYCYANFNEEEVKDNIKKHDPTSTMLIGHLQKDDIIKIRK